MQIAMNEIPARQGPFLRQVIVREAVGLSTKAMNAEQRMVPSTAGSRRVGLTLLRGRL
jgi:hypothetical protein